MPNDNQRNYPGEGHYYNQGPQTGWPNTRNFGTEPQGGKLPGQPPKRRNPMTIVVLILLVLVIILGATTFLALRHTNSSPGVAVLPATQSNPTTVPTPQVTPITPAADGTITENKLLTCSSCSSGDPIQFTIDSITIDNANGRTVWNVTLKNVSGTYYYVYNYNNQGITLQELAGTNQPVPATGYSVPQMAPGDKDTTQLIFAFVPHKGVQYTFSAHILTNSNIDMPFDPVNFTF